MAIKDRNGCLHSEANGRFISKNDTDKLKKLERVYNTHGHLNETEQEPAKLDETEREPTKLDEPQRVSKGKEYALAPSLLKKRDYREKFDLMTEDPKIAEVFFDIAKAILTHRGGSNGEDIYIYDSASGEIGKGTSGDIAYHPTYDDTLKKWLSTHWNGLIAFHNHPNSSPPSFEDINTALYRGYGKGFVLCHNGTIYEYSIPKIEITKERFDYLIRVFSIETASKVFLEEFGFYIKEVRPNVKKRKRSH